MNDFVLHKHHQKIQMCSQNLMLKKILALVGIDGTLQILDVPDIVSLTNLYIN